MSPVSFKHRFHRKEPHIDSNPCDQILGSILIRHVPNERQCVLELRGVKIDEHRSSKFRESIDS